MYPCLQRNSLWKDEHRFLRTETRTVGAPLRNVSILQMWKLNQERQRSIQVGAVVTIALTIVFFVSCRQNSRILNWTGPQNSCFVVVKVVRREEVRGKKDNARFHTCFPYIEEMAGGREGAYPAASWLVSRNIPI